MLEDNDIRTSKRVVEQNDFKSPTKDMYLPE